MQEHSFATFLGVCYLLGLSALGWLVSGHQATFTPERWLLIGGVVVLTAMTLVVVVARGRHHDSVMATSSWSRHWGNF